MALQTLCMPGKFERFCPLMVSLRFLGFSTDDVHACHAARSKAGANMDDAASASGVSTMTNDEDEAVQLLGQPGREQEIDSDFERELAQLVGGTPAGKFPTPLRIAVDLERAESIPTQFPSQD